uniref:Histone-lysine N-methyltransferase n=1 Tax=Anoplophora glabripennis TaxID=217634 RepID=V5GZS3_ANOGL
MDDSPRSERPSGFVEDHLNVLILDDPNQSTWELSTMMDRDRSTIEQHLHCMDQIKKIGVRMPHLSIEDNKIYLFDSSSLSTKSTIIFAADMVPLSQCHE